LLALGSFALCWWACLFSIDASVYYPTSYAVLLQGAQPYQGSFGLPWPMWYRYPPLFLILFFPLSLLPFRVAAFAWALGKLTVLYTLVRTMLLRLEVRQDWRFWLPAAAVAAPYWAMELRYGNAQFYVFALTASALLVARQRPILASGALGLGVALKVWPLFFVPFLALRGRRKAAAGALLVAVVLTLAPAAVFGWSQHVRWLGDWRAQESRISADSGAMWFPSQSVYGLMRRHLSEIDYAAMPDPNYPSIHWADLSPEAVRWIWLIASTAGCGLLFVGAAKAPPERDVEWAGLAFCALVLFQPFSQKQSALVVLIWPAIVAAARARGPARIALYAAGAAATLQTPLAGETQRLLQVYGLDAAVIVLLAAALLPAALSPSDAPG